MKDNARNSAPAPMTGFRWTICAMLFFATTVNYLDRQVLSLTWDEFIKPEFHWDESHYGTITAVFSFVYAACMLFAGRLIDWLGSKRGYLWAIGIWSAGACLHALCGIVTEHCVGLHTAAELAGATGDVVVTIATISMYCFLAARCVLALGEAGNFPAAIKVTAEYFPKKDRAFATSIFNAGASIGALVAPLTIPLLAKACGWELAFIIIGVLGFVWMGFWVFLYSAPAKSRHVNAAELAYIEQDSRDGQQEEQSPAKEGKPMNFIQCFRYRQTWAFALGKFMTDGVWWFFLFWIPAYLNTQFGIKTSEGLGMALIFTLYAITMLSIYVHLRRQAAHHHHQPHGAEPLRGTHEGDAHLCLLPAGGAAGAAAGHGVALVPRGADRHRHGSPPVVVGQHLLHRERHVPQVGRGHRHRHRRHGGGLELDADAIRGGRTVCLCGRNEPGLHGLRGQAGGLLHHLLHLRRGLPGRVVHHEGARAALQAHRDGLRLNKHCA